MAFLTETEMKEILESEKAPALKSELEVQGMATLAENQAKYISEEVNGSTGDIATFTNILVPAMRRIMPALFAKELVSIQPMQGPTGYVYTQRFYYKGSKDTPLIAAAKIVVGADLDETAIGATLLYKEMDASGKIIRGIVNDATADLTIGADTGIVAVYSTQAAFKQILKNYSGPYATVDGEALGSAMNQVGFKIDKVTVTAKTRKLKSEFTVELVQDLQTQHGLNAETELLNLIEFELLADIDQEILSMVRNNAVAMPDVTVAAVTGTTEASKFQGIYTQVINGCEQIVHDTKRGAGNIVVVAPKVAAALSLTGKLKGVAADLGNNVQVGAGVAVAFIGTLDNGAKVYRNAFATSNEVIIAYKGASAADAGIFYAPYVPLMVQKATNPETLQPIVAMMTRYGLVENPLVETAGVNPYFRSFNVDFAGTTLA